MLSEIHNTTDHWTRNVFGFHLRNPVTLHLHTGERENWIIWDSLAECEKERGWGEWMCSTFGLVSLDSSNEELPGWTANKDIRGEKISRFFCSSLYIHLSSYLSLLLHFASLLSFSICSLSSVCLFMPGQLSCLRWQTDWLKAKDIWI